MGAKRIIKKQAKKLAAAQKAAVTPAPAAVPSVAYKSPAGPMQAGATSSIVKDPINEVDGLWNKSKVVGSAGWSNLKDSFGGDGMDAAWGMAKIGMRGAVGGAALGGTVEAAQGGSFWTGAKEGAFNGAVGWGAYRGLKRAYGDGGGLGSTARGLGQHIKAISKQDPNVSKAVTTLRRADHHNNLAKAANNLK